LQSEDTARQEYEDLRFVGRYVKAPQIATTLVHDGVLVCVWEADIEIAVVRVLLQVIA
jgi:hypothetical protein